MKIKKKYTLRFKINKNCFICRKKYFLFSNQQETKILLEEDPQRLYVF